MATNVTTEWTLVLPSVSVTVCLSWIQQTSVDEVRSRFSVFLSPHTSTSSYLFCVCCSQSRAKWNMYKGNDKAENNSR